MSRLSLLISFMAVVGLALTFNFPAPASEAGASPGMQAPINMRVLCTDDENPEDRVVDEVTIRPWTGRFSRGGRGTATFMLTGGGRNPITYVDIELKTGDGSTPWPFSPPNQPSFRVNRGGRGVTTGPVISDIELGTYLYNIVIDCGSGRTVVDPRMEIDP